MFGAFHIDANEWVGKVAGFFNDFDKICGGKVFINGHAQGAKLDREVGFRSAATNSVVYLEVHFLDARCVCSVGNIFPKKIEGRSHPLRVESSDGSEGSVDGFSSNEALRKEEKALLKVAIGHDDY